MPAESTPISVKKVGKESRVLCIGNLSNDSTADQIKELFERYGKVLSVKFVFEKNERFGIVSFLDIRTASKAHASENILSGNKLLTAYQCPGEVVPQSLVEVKREKQTEDVFQARQNAAKVNETNEQRPECDTSQSKPPTPKNGLLVTNLLARISASNLRDSLFREFKQYGVINAIRVDGEFDRRKAIISFKRSNDALKAFIKCKDIVFLGSRIKAELHDGLDYEDPDLYKSETELQYSVNATRTLYIGNLPYSILEERLRAIFSEFGEVLLVDIKRPSKQPSTMHGASTSFAFIHFGDIKSVVRAMRKMDGYPFGKIRIKLGFGRILPSNVIWIGNLSRNVTAKDLKEFCLQYGNYRIYNVVIDHTKLQGLIYFETSNEAENCINYIRGAKLSGNRLETDFASKEFIQMRFKDLTESGSLSQNRREDGSYWQPSGHSDWMETNPSYLNVHSRERFLKTVHAADTKADTNNSDNQNKESRETASSESVLDPVPNDHGKAAANLQEQSVAEAGPVLDTKPLVDDHSTHTKLSNNESVIDSCLGCAHSVEAAAELTSTGSSMSISELSERNEPCYNDSFYVENECPGSPSSETRGEAILEWLCRLKPSMSESAKTSVVPVEKVKTEEKGDGDVLLNAIPNMPERTKETASDLMAIKDSIDTNSEIRYHLLPLTKVTRLEETVVSPKHDDEKRSGTLRCHLPVEIPLTNNGSFDLCDPRERGKPRKDVELDLLNFFIAEQVRSNHVVIYDPKAHLKHSALGISSSLEFGDVKKSDAALDINAPECESFDLLQKHNTAESSLFDTRPIDTEVFEPCRTNDDELITDPLIAIGQNVNASDRDSPLNSTTDLASLNVENPLSDDRPVILPNDSHNVTDQVNPSACFVNTSARTTAEIVENLGLTIRKVNRKESFNQQNIVENPRSILKKSESKLSPKNNFLSNIFNENDERVTSENFRDVDMRVPSGFDCISSVFLDHRDAISPLSHGVISKLQKPDSFSKTPPIQSLQTDSVQAHKLPAKEHCKKDSVQKQSKRIKRVEDTYTDSETDAITSPQTLRKRKCISDQAELEPRKKSLKTCFDVSDSDAEQSKSKIVTDVNADHTRNNGAFSSKHVVGKTFADEDLTRRTKFCEPDINSAHDKSPAICKSPRNGANKKSRLNMSTRQNNKSIGASAEKLKPCKRKRTDTKNISKEKPSDSESESAKAIFRRVKRSTNKKNTKTNDIVLLSDSDAEVVAKETKKRKVSTSRQNKQKSGVKDRPREQSNSEVDSEGIFAVKVEPPVTVLEASCETSKVTVDKKSKKIASTNKNESEGKRLNAPVVKLPDKSNPQSKKITSRVNKHTSEESVSDNLCMKKTGKGFKRTDLKSVNLEVNNEKTVVDSGVVKQSYTCDLDTKKSEIDSKAIGGENSVRLEREQTANTANDNNSCLILNANQELHRSGDCTSNSDYTIIENRLNIADTCQPSMKSGHLPTKVTDSDAGNIVSEVPLRSSAPKAAESAPVGGWENSAAVKNNQLSRKSSTESSSTKLIKRACPKSNRRAAECEKNPSKNAVKTDYLSPTENLAVNKSARKNKKSQLEASDSFQTDCVENKKSDSSDSEVLLSEIVRSSSSFKINQAVAQVIDSLISSAELCSDYSTVDQHLNKSCIVNEHLKSIKHFDESEIFELTTPDLKCVGRSERLNEAPISNANESFDLLEGGLRMDDSRGDIAVIRQDADISAAGKSDVCENDSGDFANISTNERSHSDTSNKNGMAIVSECDVKPDESHSTNEVDSHSALNLSQDFVASKGEENNDDMLSAASSLLVLHKYMPRTSCKAEELKSEAVNDHDEDKDNLKAKVKKTESRVSNTSCSSSEIDKGKHGVLRHDSDCVKYLIDPVTQESQVASIQTDSPIPFDLSTRAHPCSNGNSSLLAPPKISFQSASYSSSFPPSKYSSKITGPFHPEMPVAHPAYSAMRFGCNRPSFQFKGDISHYYHMPCQNEPLPMQYLYEMYGAYGMPPFSPLNNHPRYRANSFHDMNLQRQKLVTPPSSCFYETMSEHRFDVQKSDSLSNSDDEGNDSTSNETPLNLQTNVSNTCTRNIPSPTENIFEDSGGQHSESSSPETLDFHEFPPVNSFSHYYQGSTMPFELSLEVNSAVPIPTIPRPMFPFFCYPFGHMPYASAPVNHDYSAPIWSGYLKLKKERAKVSINLILGDANSAMFVLQNISSHAMQQDYPVIHVNGKAPLNVECFETIKEQLMKPRFSMACVTPFKNANELIGQVAEFRSSILEYLISRNCCGIASVEILNPAKVACKITFLPPCDLTKNILQMTVPYLTSIFFQTPCMLAVISCF